MVCIYNYGENMTSSQVATVRKATNDTVNIILILSCVLNYIKNKFAIKRVKNY